MEIKENIKIKSIVFLHIFNSPEGLGLILLSALLGRRLCRCAATVVLDKHDVEYCDKSRLIAHFHISGLSGFQDKDQIP